MPDRADDDEDLDLSPEVMCQRSRRRSREATMSAPSDSAVDHPDRSDTRATRLAMSPHF